MAADTVGTYVLSRALGAIGRFCIGLGVLTLLFVAYQLWGTGILTAQAQNSLENDFEDLLEQVVDVDEDALELVAELETDEPGQDEQDEPDESADGSGEEGPTPTPEPTVDPAEIERAARELELLADLIWQPAGEPVAKLSIPDIGLEWTVVEASAPKNCATAQATTPAPPMPGHGGELRHRRPPHHLGRTVQPHRRTRAGRRDHRADDPGHVHLPRDRAGVGQGSLHRQPGPGGRARSGLRGRHQPADPHRLSPKFSARQRIIVVAELVGEPAISVPRPESLGEVEVDLASEDFGDDSGEAPTGADDGGLPGDPDLDDGTAEEPVDETDPADEATEPAEDADPDDDPDEAAAAPAQESPTQPVAFQGTSESDSFGQGLNGDRDAILPAIMWGFAATAIIGATGFVARRWRRWPSYVIAVTPFALVLFVCFVHIDQALPSY